MRISYLFVAVLSCMAAVPSAQALHQHSARKTPQADVSSKSVPDLIFFNGVIYTGAGMAEDRPQTVEAIAIGGGKVMAVGTTREITRLAGSHTELHDLNTGSTGNFIFPGFNDAHTHLGSAGETKLNLDLTGVQSLDAMLAAVQRYAATLPAGHWIIGGNWDHTLWSHKVLPTREDLDRVTGDHPAFLDRIDGHIAVANSAALKAAGVSASTKASEGGAIDHDANGAPTGILRESAKELVARVIPPPSEEERRRGLELAIEDAISHGVTSVQDFSDWQDFLIYEQMEKEGKLAVRIAEWIPFKEPLALELQQRAHHDASDPMLHTTMLKGFMDGSLGSRTAAMKAPYADDPGNSGLPQYTQDELNKMAVEREKTGFQLGFHAIGDKATEMALNAYQYACEQNGPEAEHVRAKGAAHSCSPAYALKLRNRIEHAQVVDPADIPRFKALGVIASMQPNHLLTDMNWAEARLGPERAAYSYAWKAFWDAGVPLAFGTDYPVEPITPFRGLYAAVTRMNEAGTKTYYPQNKLTRGQALYAYTQGSAYAEFAEKSKGKLLPGYDADFIVVDRDLYKADASALLLTRVQAAYVGGKREFPLREGQP
jgi:predicted amidohydrolase YtcJ